MYFQKLKEERDASAEDGRTDEWIVESIAGRVGSVKEGKEK